MLNPTDVTVGWERTSFTVFEDVGSFQAYYSVVFPTTTAITSFFMRVATVIGTAGEKFFCVCVCMLANYCNHSTIIMYNYTDEDDYQRIRGSQQEQFFSNTMRRASAEVTLRTDNVYEGVEEFRLELFFASPQTGFFVIPNIATVTVLDAIIGE